MPSTNLEAGQGVRGWVQPLQGPWVPPPARTTSNSAFSDNMPSPLRSRISEMEALASLFADSGLSVAGDTSSDSRPGARMSHARTRHSDSRPARVRRKSSKAAGSQRSRRAAPAEDSVRVRRRPARDTAPPSADVGQVAPPSGQAGEVAPLTTGGRPARICSGESAGGQSAAASKETEPPPPPPPPAAEVPGSDADRRTKGSGVTCADTQLSPAELVPPLSELLPAGGGTLQEVLEKFLWAKQQASAAANLMSSLRQAVERMDQDSSRQSASEASRMVTIISDVPSQALAGAEPGRRYTGHGTVVGGSCGVTEASSNTVSNIVSHTVFHAASNTASNIASNTVSHAVSRAAFEPASETVTRSVTQAVTQAVTHSSLLTTSCSLSGRPWPSGAALRSAGSAGSGGSASSSESASLLPEESRSQLLQTGTESRASHQPNGGRQGSDLGWRSSSASETALGRAPPPAAPASQERQVEALRRQFQRQQEKLRRLEQTNYVLNLAVDGQDKTIRTLSTRLEDTKEALLEEISHQVAPSAAAAGQRRGDGTQTGPSLASVAPAAGGGGQPAAGGGGQPATGGGGQPAAGGGGQPVLSPAPPRVQSASVCPRASPPPDAANTEGGPAAAAAGERRPPLVETGTSPLPQFEPETAASADRAAAAADRAADPAESGHERNRREVKRLCAALDAKERELAALRAERANARQEEFAADQAFISTPVSGVTRTGQPVDSVWRGVSGVRTRSTERPCRPTVWPAAGSRAWSTEVFRHEVAPAAERLTRRHSFTAPAPRGGTEWRHLSSEPVRAQRSLLAEFDREGAGVGLPPTADRQSDFDDECAELQLAVNEGRTKIRRLEEEIFELKCARRRQDNVNPVLAAADLSYLGGSVPPTSDGGLGGGGGATGDPFPNIVRLTEVKLQEAYQQLVCERQRSKQLTKQAREAAHRLEQALAGSSELKQQLARSVQERQELQSQLSAAETAGAELRTQLQKLGKEVQNKDVLLSRTSQHLEERIAQVAVLGRELESARSEAARDERLAAARLDELLGHTAHLEEAAIELRQENKRLSQARDEASQLTASERRLRQRVAELQERLDQSNNTTKMLENYIHFLKSSYNSMFGAPSAASPGASLASFDEHGAARSLFHLSGGK